MFTVNGIKKITAVVVLAVIALGLFSCGSAPSDEELLARFKELTEVSFEINDIFFGEGLPTYSREEYGEEYDMLYREGDDKDYEYVKEDAKYHTVEEIKEAARAVYTEDYLASIFDMIFIGFYDEKSGSIAARYTETSSGLQKYGKSENIIGEARVYDFDSAKILMKNSEYATVEVNTSKPSADGEKTEKIRITLKNQAGTWLLDTPTY